MGKSLKRLAVLGSTGSIGLQTLEVVRALPDRFRIVGLAAGKNLELLDKQINEFKPEFIYYYRDNEPEAKVQVRSEYGGSEFLKPEDIACHPHVDTVVIAASGRAGLEPTLAAVKAGKNVALANKESLVTAGKIITGEAELSGAHILPVDSEHSAIWQCLNDESNEVSRLILTASGGPFRSYSRERLEKVTVEQALNHPSWRMGDKVTIDSATLMNKGLEVIEAHWLFKMLFDKIEVLVHPQSIIHSMVEFVDGSIKAQMSYPDMRLPIQYALTYPERFPNPRLTRIDWEKVGSFTFEQPDLELFPCLKLAIEAGKSGGTYPAALCAADEAAVKLFLSRRIRFVDIADFVERVLEQHKTISRPSIEEIIEADEWAKNKMLKLASGGS